MQLKDIERLARLVSELDLAEIEIKRFGNYVRISKYATAQSLMPAQVPQVPVSMPAAAVEQTEPSIHPEQPTHETESAPHRAEYALIKAPMIGTFYRAPAPDAPPYVEVGQILQSGQTVCIIEAMKLMNEIQSDVRGKVVNIRVENAEPVEFGQVLIEVDTSITG